MYHANSVGISSCSNSQSSDVSVSSPACCRARIAKLVSLMLPQLSEDFLSFNSSTQSSKMSSGVAKIVNASSCVFKEEQSPAFSSKQVKPSSIFSESDSESKVSRNIVSFVSFSANAGANENSSKNRTIITLTFFMY